MLTNYFTRHMQAGLYSLGKVIRSPLATLMICLIIGIALSLPAILFVALKNAESIRGSFQQSMQMTLFLKKAATEKQALSIARELQTWKSIKTIQTVSPNEGLTELQKEAGLEAVQNDMQNNPLPWAIVISPTDKASTPSALSELQNTLKQLPLAESVQLDLLWVKRLASLLSFFQRLTYALVLFLGFAVLLIVNNTIRTSTQQRRDEITIIQLIGGTNAFIRRPFLYAGMVYGLLGGVAAWGFVDALILLLRTPSQHLAELYGSQFTLGGMGFFNVFILLSGSMALGFIGSWLAVTKHLRLNRNSSL